MDTDSFAPGPRDRDALRALGVEGEAPVVLFVGIDRPTKGPDVAMGAASLVPDVEWVFVGAPPAPGAPGRWITSVPRQEMTTLLRSVDLVVAPSRYESFGVLSAESIASGTPVLSTRNGLAEFLSEHGVELPWLPHGLGAEQLASRVRDACRRLDELQQLSLLARKPLVDELRPSAWMGSLRRALGVSE